MTPRRPRARPAALGLALAAALALPPLAAGLLTAGVIAAPDAV